MMAITTRSSISVKPLACCRAEVFTRDLAENSSNLNRPEITYRFRTGGVLISRGQRATFVPCHKVLGKRGFVSRWSGILMENSSGPGNFSPQAVGHCPKKRRFDGECGGPGKLVLGCGKRAIGTA